MRRELRPSWFMEENRVDEYPVKGSFWDKALSNIQPDCVQV